MVQDMFIVSLLLLFDAALALLKFYKPAVVFFVLGSHSFEKVQLHRTFQVLFSMKKLKSSQRQNLHVVPPDATNILKCTSV